MSEEQKPSQEFKSICCGAQLHAGIMSPIDTAPTLICNACKMRDKKAEEKYGKLDSENQNIAEQSFIWH
jgi:hypothetical protein